jgi:catechol 2,3-dioxygenase-like lactoylglutathione lyase family enzyme
MKKKASRPAKRAGASKASARARAKKAPKAAAPRAKGPQDVSPGFTANDLMASIAFYRDILGFELKEKWENEGTLVGGSLAYGRATINLSQDDWKLGRDRKKGQGVRIFITTADDIDTYAKAITSRGGSLDGEPTTDWGFRAFSVTDPDGFKITFMKPIK